MFANLTSYKTPRLTFRTCRDTLHFLVVNCQNKLMCQTNYTKSLQCTDCTIRLLKLKYNVYIKKLCTIIPGIKYFDFPFKSKEY